MPWCVWRWASGIKHRKTCVEPRCTPPTPAPANASRRCTSSPRGPITPPPAPPTSAGTTKPFSTGCIATTRTARTPCATAAPGDTPPFYPATGPTARRNRRDDRPQQPRLAGAQLDGEEAQGMGLPHLRPRCLAQRIAPGLAGGGPDVEGGQEAVGQGQAGEASRPHPAVAPAVQRRLRRGGRPDLRGRGACPSGPGPWLYLGAQRSA